MNKTKFLAMILALIAGVAGCSKQQEQAKEEKPPVGVQVAEISTGNLQRKVQITGETTALTTVDVQPKLSGVLQSLRRPDGELLKIGDRVEKGQVLAEIEHAAQSAGLEAAKAALARAQTQAQPDVIRATIQQAKAAADAAKAQLAEVETNLKNLEKENNRMVQLLKEGTVTEQQHDKTQTAYAAAIEQKEALQAQVERAQAAYDLAQAQTSQLAQAAVAQAQAAVDQAQAVVDDATIEAPLSGVVSMLPVDEGDMVGPGALLMQIVDMETVKILGGVSERFISYLKPGQTKVSVETDAYTGRQFKGTVFRVGPAIDRATRTIEIEARLPNEEHLLKPGMFARITLILEERKDVPVVQEDALLHNGDETFAYIVSDNKAVRKDVKLGIREGETCEVLEGLALGDRVIVHGQQIVTDGDDVKIVTGNETEQKPAAQPEEAATEEKP